MFYIFLFLHFVCLPLAIIAAVITGLYEIAMVDGAVFLILLALYAVLRKK